MAPPSENDELPILLPVPEATSRDQTRALHSRNRSVSFSSSTSYSTNRVDNSNVFGSGPLYSTRRPDQSLSLPSHVQPPESSLSSSTVDVPSEEDECVLKNANLLKSGELGMCNDPYCTTCPSYYNSQTAKFHTYKVLSDSRTHSALYDDAKGWAKRFASCFRRFVPGIINPHSKYVQMWNRFLAYSCLLSIFIDPAFVFLLYMSSDKKCTEIDWPKARIFVLLRSMSDLIFFINMMLQFRLAYVAPESTVVGAGQLVVHPGKIACNYLIGKFPIDVLIVLPLPQRMIFSILPASLGTPKSEFEQNMIITVFVLQYIPKLIRLLPLIVGQSPTGFIFESAWANFIINILTFMFAGHAVGSFWYLGGLLRVKKCLFQAGNFTMDDRINLIDCTNEVSYPRAVWSDSESVNACFQEDGFSFGIYLKAVNLTTEPNIFTRFSFSLFWGFQHTCRKPNPKLLTGGGLLNDGHHWTRAFAFCMAYR
ncbi:putative cyclic nucleotide-gated ion channel 19 [Raphanus sativus]|nr:putative cyclic nucleotide-gated ion channel 19 [Raphanus sativus]